MPKLRAGCGKLLSSFTDLREEHEYSRMQGTARKCEGLGKDRGDTVRTLGGTVKNGKRVKSWRGLYHLGNDYNDPGERGEGNSGKTVADSLGSRIGRRWRPLMFCSCINDYILTP